MSGIRAKALDGRALDSLSGGISFYSLKIQQWLADGRDFHPIPPIQRFRGEELRCRFTFQGFPPLFSASPCLCGANQDLTFWDENEKNDKIDL